MTYLVCRYEWALAQPWVPFDPEVAMRDGWAIPMPATREEEDAFRLAVEARHGDRVWALEGSQEPLRRDQIIVVKV